MYQIKTAISSECFMRKYNNIWCNIQFQSGVNLKQTQSEQIRKEFLIQNKVLFASKMLANFPSSVSGRGYKIGPICLCGTW